MRFENKLCFKQLMFIVESNKELSVFYSYPLQNHLKKKKTRRKKVLHFLSETQYRVKWGSDIELVAIREARGGGVAHLLLTTPAHG